MRKQLDKNLSFHKLVAYMIALMTGELKGGGFHVCGGVNDMSAKQSPEWNIFRKSDDEDADSHTFKTLVCLPCSSSFFQPVHPGVE